MEKSMNFTGELIKSPIHYMGNKYKLLPQLLNLFPSDIDTLYDLFGGSGCVSLNVPANKVVYNELNDTIYSLFTMFDNNNADTIIKQIENNIESFKLDQEDRESFLKFREYYNKSDKSIFDLFTLTFYGFCNLIRLNSNNEFNIPFGNRCFNSDGRDAIVKCCERIKSLNISFYNEDAFNFFSNNFNKNDFIYLDPPYSNTIAVYNGQGAFDDWTVEHDFKLFKELDKLSDMGIRWGMSNVFKNRDTVNSHLIEWADNYNVEHLDFNYRALAQGNANADEVYIYNYDIVKCGPIDLW